MNTVRNLFPYHHETLGSFNGEGSTFTIYRRGGWTKKKRPRGFLPGSCLTRFPAVDAADYIEMIGGYIRRTALMLRDLEFQLLSAERETGNSLEPPPFDPGGLDENPLLPYASTLWGIRTASCGILALETAKRSEELEKAALAGDMDFVRMNHAAFLNYMGFFLAGLKRFLKEERQYLVT
ncbi:MAG: hypothetical protein LBD31_02380 [Treponema sp.]|nr:hypothetical protein [Treponema sp.]